MEKMVAALSGHAAHHARLQLSIVGGFQDNKNVSQSLLIPVLGRGKHRLHVCHTHTAIAATIQKNPNYFEPRQLCVGEAVTTVEADLAATGEADADVVGVVPLSGLVAVLVASLTS